MTAPTTPDGAFSVSLENFEGPFDLLLRLIAKHQLDVTEVALSKVTDDFIAHVRAGGPEWDLEETSEFLLVAATLLDLKAARLLPAGQVEDEADLALLEARDLLFARLLQYRAFRLAAELLADRLAVEGRRFPRTVALEPRYAAVLPEVVVGVGPAGLAAVAARVLAPRPVPTVSLAHLHQPRVSVREQAAVVVERVRRAGTTTLRELTADCPTSTHVVARFLALLELFRDGAVELHQVTPLGEVTVRWTGPTDRVDVGTEFDEDLEPSPEARPDPGPDPSPDLPGGTS